MLIDETSALVAAVRKQLEARHPNHAAAIDAAAGVYLEIGSIEKQLADLKKAALAAIAGTSMDALQAEWKLPGMSVSLGRDYERITYPVARIQDLLKRQPQYTELFGKLAEKKTIAGSWTIRANKKI